MCATTHDLDSVTLILDVIVIPPEEVTSHDKDSPTPHDVTLTLHQLQRNMTNEAFKARWHGGKSLE